MDNKSFTLMELTVVIIIVGILATLAFVQYGGYRENSIDREAQANLRLIMAAERIYRIEIGVYYPSAGADPQAHIDDINTNLRLSLNRVGNRNWNYQTTVGGGSPTCTEAQRINGPDSRTWRMRNTEDNPRNDSLNDTCP